MTEKEIKNSLKDIDDCLDLHKKITENIFKCKAIFSTLNEKLYMGYTFLDPDKTASIIENHENNSFLFAAGCDYIGETMKTLDALEDELNAMIDSLRSDSFIEQ